MSQRSLQQLDYGELTDDDYKFLESLTLNPPSSELDFETPSNLIPILSSNPEDYAAADISDLHLTIDQQLERDFANEDNFIDAIVTDSDLAGSLFPSGNDIHYKGPSQPSEPSKSESNDHILQQASVSQTLERATTRRSTEIDNFPSILQDSPEASETNKQVDSSKLTSIEPILDEFEKLFNALSLDNDKNLSIKERTLVILSPNSYKHKYNRFWEPKANLKYIVERPERLMACSIGMGCALSAFPNAFDIEASTKLVDLTTSVHVAKVHGTNWGAKLQELCKIAAKQHANKKVEVPEGWHEGDIYLTEETYVALQGVVGAVECAVDGLFKGEITHDRAFVAIRPPGHHSHPCQPSGFCLLNNAHIAIQYAGEQYSISHAVILDFDLHHGDGSQDICWYLSGLEQMENKYVPPCKDSESESSPTKSRKSSRNKPAKKDPQPDVRVGYFSLHDINSFPTEFGYATAEGIKNASVCLMAHGMCIWNVHLEQHADMQDFDHLYRTKYSTVFAKADEYLQSQKKEFSKKGWRFNPMVVISAGFDASEFENPMMQRHGVSVPTSFYNTFTNDTLAFAKRFSTPEGQPMKILSLLEGGYSDGALSTGLHSHLTGLAGQVWENEWSSHSITKDMEKACKLKTPIFNSQTPSWLSDGVQLGRSLWPTEIQEKVKTANMAKPATARKRYTNIGTSNRTLRSRDSLSPAK